MRKITKLRQTLQISHSDVICALRYYSTFLQIILRQLVKLAKRDGRHFLKQIRVFWRRKNKFRKFIDEF